MVGQVPRGMSTVYFRLRASRLKLSIGPLFVSIISLTECILI